MKTEMTERDKKLLYMLGFIVIIFLFVIIADRPLFRKIRATNKEIEKEQATHDTIQMKLDRMSIVEGYREKIGSKVDLYAARYYPMMDSTQIDDLLTGRVLDQGLKAVDLYIDMPREAVELSPYPYSEAGKAMTEEGNASGGNGADPDYEQVEAFTNTLQSGEAPDIEATSDQVVDTALSGVKAATVDMKVFGREERLKVLLDKLIADQSLRVTGYTWEVSPGNGFSFVDGQLVELAETDKQLVINLQVLMYDETAFIATTTDTEEENE